MDKKRLFNARVHEMVLGGAQQHHTCSVRYCDPQNEQRLIQRQLLQGPPILPEHLYICKFGDLHQCAENTCMAEGPCLVSGATMGLINEYGSYDPQDSRTWNTETVAPPTKKRKLYDTIEHLLDTLFYSPKRKDIVAHWNRQKSRQAKKYRESYIKTCELKRVPVNAIHMAMIDAQYNIKCPIEAKPERDMERLDRYVHMALELFKHVQQYSTPDGICLESVCLGMVYKMQHGININDVQLLPIDPWLIQVLPPMNDLVKLGIDKKKINRGEHLLSSMYENVERKGIDLLEVAL